MVSFLFRRGQSFETGVLKIEKRPERSVVRFSMKDNE
jgi:hypothetical protein